VCSVAENGDLVSSKCCAACTAECEDVSTFKELQGAIIDGDGDIKLCSGTIVFTEQIILTHFGKKLTFTCPNGDCILDAKSNSRFFLIQDGISNTSFDGITFKNGNTGQESVSPQ